VPVAKIKSVYQCPRCQESLTASERPEHCPKCGFEFDSAAETATYVYPRTLSEQHEQLADVAAFTDACLAMPITKANDILNDALTVIRTLPAKNVAVSGIRDLIEMGIRIGEMAEKYKEFLEAGGAHVPDLVLRAEETRGAKNDVQKEGARTDTP
jgi:hypothetical protein